jgi:signal transduction histidine kinase
MLLKNNLSNAWLLNVLTVVFLLILIVEWLSAIVLLILGSGLAIILFYLTISQPIIYVAAPIAPSDFIGAFVVTIIFGILFSRNKAQLVNDKLATLRSMAASIAHELRTPLATIRMTARLLNKYLPPLLKDYKQIELSGQSETVLNDNQIKQLQDGPNRIQAETQAASIFIDMLLMNVKSTTIGHKKENLSIRECINEAINRYPFTSDQKALIHWQENLADFYFEGDRILMVHVFFNLIKNALYYIAADHDKQGKIVIRVAEDKKQIYFKDTGIGIKEKDLPHIFDRFYSKTYHGTGIGLAFCKMVMQRIGGRIHCDSKEGEYTEFKLDFL